MEKTTVNPFFVALFFVLRCFVPMVIMLGISYLLRRLGVIAEPPAHPNDQDNEDNSDHPSNSDQGGPVHGTI